MCDIVMMTNYIYLLQEREFIKTKENVYKIGMTKKENHKRFNQYPKGSILLFQIICNNCKNIETQIIKLFKEKYKQRRDIGSEYFEGSYKNMIELIFQHVQNEDNENTDEEYIIEEDTDEEDIDEEEFPIYEISTYEEWIKYNDINKIIITNKKYKEGFIKLKNYLWKRLYDTTNLEFKNEEDLLGFIQNRQYNTLLKNKITNEFISYENYYKLDDNEQNNYEKNITRVEYNVEKILIDVIKKCYVKKYDLYNLNYCEYVFPINDYSSFVIFNSINFTFTPIDEIINNKILTSNYAGYKCFYTKNIINVDIVDDILNSLINNNIKTQYKKLVYNIIVKQEEKPIIFYDYNDGLLTTWITDLLYHISGHNFYITACKYYDNKLDFTKLLKTHKYKCVKIYARKDITIEKQINDFHNLGFKNIIVYQQDKKNNMYNIVNFKKYLQDNKEILLKYIKEEYNYEPDNWNYLIQYGDNIFYSEKMLLTNFLKWCCIK